MAKILIDAVSLLSPLTGIGKYTYEISKRLLEIKSNKDEIFFNYGHHSKELYSLDAFSSREIRTKRLQSSIKKIPFLKKFSRHFFIFITKFSSHKYDIYFQPNHIPNPNIKTKKVVCTVHDFSFLLHPQWHQKETIEYFKRYFIKYTKNADIIITGSHFTKQEILQYTHFKEDKIVVIHHGVDHAVYRRYSKEALKEISEKFDLPNNFLLFVGSIEPRKNLETLIEAYSMFDEEQQKSLPLILVGFKGWKNSHIMEMLKKHKRFIRYLGYVSEEELSKIYNLATIFIYPSLYEGFGLPSLEALACGTPCIVSNVASLPEVCGNAVLYIDPLSSQDIKNKILLLAHNKDLREELSQRSIIQASSFSWDKSASEHAKILWDLKI
jgi:glycosyltransferase involved in cell wall biosynthesis